MATTGHWYINPDGTKVDFTDPSADINAAAGTVTRELRKVTAHSGQRPEVTLWKAAGSKISSGEITAAIADQDSAAVPAIRDTNDAAKPGGHVSGDRPGGAQHAVIADVPTGGSATAAANATAINGILATLRANGLVAT